MLCLLNASTTLKSWPKEEYYKPTRYCVRVYYKWLWAHRVLGHVARKCCVCGCNLKKGRGCPKGTMRLKGYGVSTWHTFEPLMPIAWHLNMSWMVSTGGTLVFSAVHWRSSLTSMWGRSWVTMVISCLSRNGKWRDQVFLQPWITSMSEAR